MSNKRKFQPKATVRPWQAPAGGWVVEFLLEDGGVQTTIFSGRSNEEAYQRAYDFATAAYSAVTVLHEPGGMTGYPPPRARRQYRVEG